MHEERLQGGQTLLTMDTAGSHLDQVLLHIQEHLHVAVHP